MSVSVTLEDETDLSRGDMIVKPNNKPEISQDIHVLIFWMSKIPLNKGKKIIVKHTSIKCLSVIKELKYKIDINTLHKDTNIDQIELNEIGRVIIRTSKPLFVDSYTKNRITGSLIIIDEQTNETIGAGIIK